mmetsp:Transcript_33489/g.79445  ORF Transcript_33489/g.79445 Transcript_33489/m.79445 type:complete len:125 (-) Transcript_33489:11-385(-)
MVLTQGLQLRASPGPDPQSPQKFHLLLSEGPRRLPSEEVLPSQEAPSKWTQPETVQDLVPLPAVPEPSELRQSHSRRLIGPPPPLAGAGVAAETVMQDIYEAGTKRHIVAKAYKWNFVGPSWRP